MKRLSSIIFLIITLYSCSEYKKFTLYKQKPFDNTSVAICSDIFFRAIYISEPSKIFFGFSNFSLNSNGSINYSYQDGSNENVNGHYIIRHDSLYLQSFGFDAGGTYKKYLEEYFGKLINDSTIMIFLHRCRFCHDQFSGYRESPDIYFDPPIEFNVTSTSNKSEVVSGWFLKKKWYKKNVWYNNQ